MFCAKCGKAITLPEIDLPPGAQNRLWIQQEEAVVLLRSAYDVNLVRVKSLRSGHH
jgi:hypothetical protein